VGNVDVCVSGGMRVWGNLCTSKCMRGAMCVILLCMYECVHGCIGECVGVGGCVWVDVCIIRCVGTR